MPIVDLFVLGRSPVFPLNPSQEQLTNLSLNSSAPPTAIIRGTVSDPSGAAVAGATVKLMTSAGDPVDHQDTNPAGNFIFNGVVPGSYTIAVAKTGYVTSATASVSVNGGQQVTVNFTLTPSTSPQGSIYGFVNDASTGAPLGGAEGILLSASTTLAVAISVSDAAGQLLFCNIPNGSYILVVGGLEGYYQSTSTPINISSGGFVFVSVTLSPVSIPQATVNGVITDTSGTPIPNACVGLYTLDGTGLETLQQVTFTDSGGRYLFGRATAGNYVVKAKAETTVPVIP